jgi:hypothetical protein
MATTTNFGWTTPDDTDLVKDGAAAIRTLAGNIDTSLVDLKGGTTGQVLSKASGTDLDFTFTTISAGGMTLISTTTCSSTSVTLSSIPQTYKSLYIIAKNITFASGANGFRVLPNNVNNLTDQSQVREGTANNLTNGVIRLSGGGSEMNNSTNNAWALTINNYTATDSYKPFSFSGFCVNGSATNREIIGGGAFRSNTEITSLVFDIEGATFTGGTILFYGVN